MLKEFLHSTKRTSGGDDAEIMADFYKSKLHRRIMVLDFLKDTDRIDDPRYRSLTLQLALDMMDASTRGEPVLTRLAKAGMLTIGG